MGEAVHRGQKTSEKITAVMLPTPKELPPRRSCGQSDDSDPALNVRGPPSISNAQVDPDEDLSAHCRAE